MEVTELEPELSVEDLLATTQEDDKQDLDEIGFFLFQLNDGQPQPRLYDLNENRQDPLSNTQYAFAWTLCVLRVCHY